MSLTQDCLTANLIWRKMGQTTIIPSKCCNSNGITCSSTRITSISWERSNLKNSIPSEIGKLTGLTSLTFFDNSLSGPIPSTLGNLINLQFLILNYNLLSGPIPSTLGKLTNLMELVLDANELTGAIPSTLGNVRNLQYLHISGNNLSGSIPSTIGNLGKLETLDLSWNQLSGSIPSKLGNLLNLNDLHLNDNRLSGSIPSTIGLLENLGILDLSYNQLSGPLPTSGNLISLHMLYLNDNLLSGTIPSILGMMDSLSTIYFQNNQFSGSIPPTLGNLHGLHTLYLYNNHLTGYPSNLKATDLKIFPNPMSDIPYDKVIPASAGTVSTVTWDAFLSTKLELRKRNQLSVNAPISIEELIKTCDLKTAELPAGCIAGVFNKYCTKPSNSTLLLQCHDAYNRAFGASVFKTLGDACPAWKAGPKSQICATAVSEFKGTLEMGKHPVTGQTSYLTLNATHAEELRRNIFASPKYAPCVPSNLIKCSWI